MMYEMLEPQQAEQQVAEAPKPRVRRSGLGTGTTSLLMIFTLLCLATLALLSLSTATSDARIKGRGLAAAQSLAAAEGDAAEKLAELDEILAVMHGSFTDTDEYLLAVAAALPGDFAMDGDTVAFTVRAWEDRVLVTVVRVLPPGGGARYELVSQTQESTAEWKPEAGGGVWLG